MVYAKLRQLRFDDLTRESQGREAPQVARVLMVRVEPLRVVLSRPRWGVARVTSLPVGANADLRRQIRGSASRNLLASHRAHRGTRAALAAHELHQEMTMSQHENANATDTLDAKTLSSVSGGFPGQDFLRKAIKKVPGIGTLYGIGTAAKSGLDASRQYAREERAAGFQPSAAQQVGVGALNATTTFINQAMYGLPQFILDHTRPRSDQH
jgi:hypothetical protein